MTQRDTKLVLRRGRKLIETCGWLQGAYGDGTHGYCALGSLRAASTNLGSTGELDDDSHEVYLDALEALRIVVNGDDRGFGYLPIPEWNDDPTQTKAQVLDALEAAELYI